MKFQVRAGMWPVVQRELREAARRPLNHWLRFGAALVGVGLVCAVPSGLPESETGTFLFDHLHLLLLCLICGLVPALTADSIARERREGTLGLLFMTPLTASGIVVGKILAQMLRAVTLWMALLPLLAIPFLYGGVTWADIAALLTIELCAGMICLAAGVLASSLTENRAMAFFLAFLFTAIFVGGSGEFQNQWSKSSRPAWRSMSWTITSRGGPYSISWPPGVAAPPPGVVISNFIVSVQPGTAFPSGRRMRFGAAPRAFAGPMMPFAPAATPMGFAARQPPADILAEYFCIAGVFLLAAIRFAGWRVENSWQDKLPSVQGQDLTRRYCTPVFKDWFAHTMRRALERNPIAWLQQYSWKARLSKWGLCLLFVLLECFVLDENHPDGLGRLLEVFLWILAGAYTFAGVNGFLQEKKSGALELILVSPLSVNQIIFGRVWGLWKQFLPSALVLVGSDIACQLMVPQDHFIYIRGGGVLRDWIWVYHLEMAAIFLTLPVVATCFALSAKNLFVAFALTVTMEFAPAAILWSYDHWFYSVQGWDANGWFMDWLKFVVERLLNPLNLLAAVLAAHACLAILAYWILRRSLARRSYAF
jgi:ABC-type Na+ efflux pump permease subunit